MSALRTRSIAALLVVGVALSAASMLGRGAPGGPSGMPRGDLPELSYLRQVNAWRPADPQLVFLLMAQFANANQQAEGVAYFEALRQRFDDRLSPTQRAVYLTAIASLRAGMADDVFMLRRVGWIRDTLAMLDQAKRLTGGQMYAVRWMSGVVRARVPGWLGERSQAIADLVWCLEHADKAPDAGWSREVHVHLATLYRASGDVSEARRHQGSAGYASDGRPILLNTAFSESPREGHRFATRVVREVIPGTLYALSGIEFTEYYFIVSEDRKQLIAIDAGTRPDAARQALETLRAQVAGLPALTTVFITHAHWDHVGGHGYLRQLDPAPRFVGRGNYADELRIESRADPATMRRFFGEKFSMSDVTSYQPDVPIDQDTEMVVGDTRFALLPVRGGETSDALLIHMPQHGVLFVGDILMPYVGAPFVEEGSVDGMLAGIDQVIALRPRVLLHGHEPLTRVFDSTAMLAQLRPQLAWLHERVVDEIGRGVPRARLQQANLIPPAMEQASSAVHVAYLVLRENVINRDFDQHSGY